MHELAEKETRHASISKRQLPRNQRRIQQPEFCHRWQHSWTVEYYRPDLYQLVSLKTKDPRYVKVSGSFLFEKTGLRVIIFFVFEILLS